MCRKGWLTLVRKDCLKTQLKYFRNNSEHKIKECENSTVEQGFLTSHILLIFLLHAIFLNV